MSDEHISPLKPANLLMSTLFPEHIGSPVHNVEEDKAEREELSRVFVHVPGLVFS